LAPSGALIQLDIDPNMLGRNYPVTVPMAGEIKTSLRELLFHMRRSTASGEHPAPAPRPEFLDWKKTSAPFLDDRAAASDAAPLKPQRLMRELSAALPENAIIFIDSGNNTLWATHYLDATGKNAFVHNWGEFGAMGFGVAAAIGGKVAAPDRPVVAVVGDGAFAMNGMEVSTAATYDIPVVWVVLNDSKLNAVYHGQKLLYEGRTIGCDIKRMDIAKIAEGLGAEGRRVTEAGEIGPALREALASGRPTVLDVWIDAEEVPPIHSRIKSIQKFFAGMAA
jgi:acetolactate synthase-1/2/3 large subunit